jgi:hypothetical protein
MTDAGAAVAATPVLEANDVPYEEDIIRNPYSVRDGTVTAPAFLPRPPRGVPSALSGKSDWSETFPFQHTRALSALARTTPLHTSSHPLPHTHTHTQVKCWLRYLEHKKKSANSVRFQIYERAVKQLPGR